MTASLWVQVLQRLKVKRILFGPRSLPEAPAPALRRQCPTKRIPPKTHTRKWSASRKGGSFPPDHPLCTPAASLAGSAHLNSRLWRGVSRPQPGSRFPAPAAASARRRRSPVSAFTFGSLSVSLRRRRQRQRRREGEEAGPRPPGTARGSPGRPRVGVCVLEKGAARAPCRCPPRRPAGSGRGERGRRARLLRRVGLVGPGAGSAGTAAGPAPSGPPPSRGGGGRRAGAFPRPRHLRPREPPPAPRRPVRRPSAAPKEGAGWGGRRGAAWEGTSRTVVRETIEALG